MMMMMMKWRSTKYSDADPPSTAQNPGATSLRRLVANGTQYAHLMASRAQPWMTKELVTRRCRRLAKMQLITTTLSTNPSPAVMNKNRASFTLSGKLPLWCSEPWTPADPGGISLLETILLTCVRSSSTLSSWQPPAPTRTRQFFRPLRPKCVWKWSGTTLHADSTG